MSLGVSSWIVRPDDPDHGWSRVTIVIPFGRGLGSGVKGMAVPRLLLIEGDSSTLSRKLADKSPFPN